MFHVKHQYVALNVSCEKYIFVGEDIILPIGEPGSSLRIKGDTLKNVSHETTQNGQA